MTSRKQSMYRALIGFALLLSATCSCAAESLAPVYPIKGLIDVKAHKRVKWWHLRGPRTYVYSLEGTDKTAELPHRIKSVPDLRTGSSVQSKIREKVIFYMPLLQLGWGVYTVVKKGTI